VTDKSKAAERASWETVWRPAVEACAQGDPRTLVSLLRADVVIPRQARDFLASLAASIKPKRRRGAPSKPTVAIKIQVEMEMMQLGPNGKLKSRAAAIEAVAARLGKEPAAIKAAYYKRDEP
jgi:hypothetical protein